MKIVIGNIWAHEFDDHLRVIPVNIGWKANGENVMGRGVARQAATRFPNLQAWYGWRCEAMAGNACLYRYYDLVLFPVKPLNKEKPYLSWQQPASLELIRASARQLASQYYTERVVLPLVGCGNGELDPVDVLPILDDILCAPGFVLVMRPQDVTLNIQKWSDERLV